MLTTKQRLSLQGSPRLRRRLLSTALFLSLAALPGAASAIEIKNVQGDGTCPDGWTPLTFADAVANKSAACGALAQWDIARLADGGSMDGPGYQCQIRGSDTRTLGNSLCAKRETLEAGKLKVCLYPGFAPFVNKDMTGWDVTYLQGFAHQQGLTFVPVQIEKFDDIWTLAGEGRCDISASGISDLRSRRKQTGCAGDWSDHYYTVSRAFAVRTTDVNQLKEVKNLVGKTVIVTGGSTADLDLVNQLACAKPKIEQCKTGQEDTSSCVKILRMDDEEEAAKKVSQSGAFAYGGGYGSIEHLANAKGSGLKLAWPHCNMLQDCSGVSEPFSFVVRHASTGLVEALNDYIKKQKYPGPSSPTLCPPAPW